MTPQVYILEARTLHVAYRTFDLQPAPGTPPVEALCGKAYSRYAWQFIRKSSDSLCPACQKELEENVP